MALKAIYLWMLHDDECHLNGLGIYTLHFTYTNQYIKIIRVKRDRYSVAYIANVT